MNHDILYLASNSYSRKYLLEQSLIPFKIIKQTSTESIQPKEHMTAADLAEQIALDKMNHSIIPNELAYQGNIIYVLTADSLIYLEKTKTILGKPHDKAHAINMIKSYQNQNIIVSTACVLSKKNYIDHNWINSKITRFTVSGTIEYSIPDEEIERYLSLCPLALHACGAATIEGIGSNYLKYINGSYSAIMGLPLFELRIELKKLGFIF